MYIVLCVKSCQEHVENSSTYIHFDRKVELAGEWWKNETRPFNAVMHTGMSRFHSCINGNTIDSKQRRNLMYDCPNSVISDWPQSKSMIASTRVRLGVPYHTRRCIRCGLRAICL